MTISLHVINSWNDCLVWFIFLSSFCLLRSFFTFPFSVILYAFIWNMVVGALLKRSLREANDTICRCFSHWLHWARTAADCDKSLVRPIIHVVQVAFTVRTIECFNRLRHTTYDVLFRRAHNIPTSNGLCPILAQTKIDIIETLSFSMWIIMCLASCIWFECTYVWLWDGIYLDPKIGAEWNYPINYSYAMMWDRMRNEWKEHTHTPHKYKINWMTIKGKRKQLEG